MPPRSKPDRSAPPRLNARQRIRIEDVINGLSTAEKGRPGGVATLSPDGTVTGAVNSVAAVAPLTTTGTSAVTVSTSIATARIVGRTTAGTGVMEQLTVTAPVTVSAGTVNVSTMTGDSGSGGARGVVPAPAAGDAAAGKFLKADGTWAAPTSSGSSVQINTTAKTTANFNDSTPAAVSGVNVLWQSSGSSVSAYVQAATTLLAGVAKLGASGGAQEYGKIAGVTVSGTPSPGRMLLASSATAAAWRIPASAQAMYGSGADGALTLDGSASIVVGGATIAPVGGVYTLTRDVEATTITMSSTAQLRTAGFRVRCWKLVGESTNRIHDDGNDASGSTNGATISGGTLQRNGSQGGVGVGIAANGNSGNNVTIGVGGVGGTGGAAGVRSGGSGGTVSSMTATAGRYPGGFASLTGWAGTTGSPSAQAVSGGSGGGSGGNATGAGTSSGGGGGGAGRVYIAALEVDYAGTIAADGGDGGAASGGGNAGGGAGGGGGEVLLITEQLTRTPTLSAGGGAGGAGVGTGAAGASGSAGITNTISPQV